MPALVDAGPTATSRSDRFLFGGLVALVVAATMSGLRTDVTIWGHELTIRPDQVVLLALLPAIAVALTRRGLARSWSLLHLPVFAFLAANAVASVAASGVPRREPPGHGAHDRLRRDVHRGRGPGHRPAGVGPSAPRGRRRARLRPRALRHRGAPAVCDRHRRGRSDVRPGRPALRHGEVDLPRGQPPRRVHAAPRHLLGGPSGLGVGRSPSRRVVRRLLPRGPRASSSRWLGPPGSAFSSACSCSASLS